MLVKKRVEEELEKRKEEIEQEVAKRVEEAKRKMETEMMQELERQREQQRREELARQVTQSFTYQPCVKTTNDVDFAHGQALLWELLFSQILKTQFVHFNVLSNTDIMYKSN